MKKTFVLIALTGLTALGCNKTNLLTDTARNNSPSFSEAAATSNGSEQSWDVPLSSVFYNECCNEDVYVTGTAHFVLNRNVMHVEVSHLTGIGLTTGFTYTGVGPSVSTNVFYDDHYVGILTLMLNMRNENGCSFRLKATFQSHVNAAGETTVYFEKFETFCH